MDGMDIAVSVFAVLIALICLIATIRASRKKRGGQIGED